MALGTQKTGKINTVAIVASILVFVSLLLLLPYYLTQQSQQNSSQLNARLHVDETFNAQLQDILDLNDSEWQPVDNFNFGLSSQAHWLKLIITPSTADQAKTLLVNYSLLDHIDVWFLSSKQSGSEVLREYRTGDALAYKNRIVRFEQFLFNVPAYDDDLTVFLRATSKGPVKVPVELWQESEFIEHSGLHKLFIGLFFGFMIAMALSNMFIYASTRNLIFAIYTGYVTSITLAVASLHGIGYHYIWPNKVWLQELAVPIFACLSMIFIMSFTIRLLKLKTMSVSIYRVLRIMRIIFFLLLAMCLFLPYEVIIKTLLVLLLITTPIIIASGIILALNGSVLARYICAAWSLLLISCVAILLESFGFFHSPIDANYLLMVGAIIEALLLALALAINFSEQLFEASKTKNLAVNNKQEAVKARDELIALQEKNQADLEYSIEERTLELEIALRELSEKNSELEKLSAIDPLTGLMNRRYFDKRLLAETRRSKRELSCLGLAMLDIDHFKKINDTYGHLCGDHCLKVFSQVLKEHIQRPSDVICRYGGEEFVLILPNTDLEGISKLLEKIRFAVQDKKILFEGAQISMTVSIGACSRIVATEDEHTVLVGFVDKQLYEAKDSGRNCVKLSTF